MYLATALGGALAMLILAIVHYRLVRSPIVFLPSIIIYYWTLHGGIRFILAAQSDDLGPLYNYLFGVLFPVVLDENYAWSLFCLVVFCLLHLLSVCCLSYTFTL